MNKFSWQGLLLIAAGAGIIIAGIVFLVIKREDMSSYPAVEAEVLSGGYDVSGNRIHSYVRLRYTVDGKEYTEDYSAEPAGTKEGDKILVHYDPEHPERINPRINPAYLLMIVFGTTAVILGICLMILKALRGR